MIDGKTATLIGLLADSPALRPIAGATPHPCARCARDVMLSPASRARLHEVEFVHCVECVVAICKERGIKLEEGARTDAQVAELIANGYPGDRFGVR